MTESEIFCDLDLRPSLKIQEEDDEYIKAEKLDTIINECSKKFTNVIITKMVGRGTFGKVFVATGEYEHKTINIAIKHIHNLKSDVKNIYGMNDEYDVFKKMSELDLSPRMYEGIEFETDEGLLNKAIIMERYDIDCHNLFKSVRFTYKLKHKLMNDIFGLIIKTVQSGISCIDMKLENFMYKEEGQVVKMIDFGEYCSCTDKDKDKLMYDRFKFTENCNKHIKYPTLDDKKAFQACEIIYNLIIIKHIMFNSQIFAFLRYYFNSEGEQYTTLKDLSIEEEEKRNKIYLEIGLLNKQILQFPIMKNFMDPTNKELRCYFAFFISPEMNNPLSYIRNKTLVHYCKDALKENNTHRVFKSGDLAKIIILNGLDDSPYSKNIKKYIDYGRKEFKKFINEVKTQRSKRQRIN